MPEQKTALVLGATGGVGGETARRLVAHGWRVRALSRRPDALSRAFEPVAGDALDSAAVRAAAEDADLIVHAVNPPGYRDWGRLAVPMLDNTIAAARETGARIAFPGTVYNYGPDAGARLAEDAPQNPLTRKGAIRVEMERRLERAAADGVRTTILRCGDFFGPRPGNNWFSDGLVQPGKPVRRVMYPGARDLPHNWAYLPDVAEAFVRLIERPGPHAAFERFHFAGQDATGHRFVQAIARAVGRERLPVLPLPWPILALAAPFNETLREMREMRYLWTDPVFLDGARLEGAIGPEPRTDLDEAVRLTLQGLGCLAQPQAALRAALV